MQPDNPINMIRTPGTNHGNLAKLLLTGIICVTALSAYAQQVTGIVVSSSTKQTIPNAGITLFAASGANVAGTISQTTGTFVLGVRHGGRYRLRVSFVGLKTFEREVDLESGKTLNVGNIVLDEAAETMREVVVKAVIPLATQRGDTMVMKAKAYKTNPDASVEDLVQKMPGIVSESGTLKAQGEEVKQVLVDGKEFFKNDITAALKNLPASIVDEIQVFDARSDQSRFTGFDDGNRLKTINIVTTTGVARSRFGRMTAGYGSDGRYTAGGNLNRFDNDRRISVITQFNNTNERNFNMGDMFGGGGDAPAAPPGMQTPSMGGSRSASAGGGISNFTVDTQNGITRNNAIGLNFSDQWGKKVRVDGSYFFNYSNNSSMQSSVYDYIVNRGQRYSEDKTTGSNITNHRFNFRLDYDIDDRNSLFIRPAVSFQQSSGTAFSAGRTDSLTAPLSAFSSRYTPLLHGLKLSGEVLYRHRFGRKGRTLSVDINSTSQTKDGTNSLNSVTRYYASADADTLAQTAGIHAKGYSFSSNVSYSEPIDRRSMVMANYMYGYQEARSDQKGYDYDAATGLFDRPDSSITNIYRSFYTTHTAGMSYLYHKNNLNFNAQLSYQHARLSGENDLLVSGKIPVKSYNNLLPSVRLRYNLPSSAHLDADYMAQASSPSIDQLQEITDNSVPTQLVVGNSRLSQTYRHNLSVRFFAPDAARATVFMCFLDGSLSNNYIGNKTIVASTDTFLTAYGQYLGRGSQLTTYDNLHGYYSLRGMVGYGFPLLPVRTNIHLMLNASVSRTPGIINGNYNYNKQSALGGDLILSSNISQNIDFMINGRLSCNKSANSQQSEPDTRYWSLFSGAHVNIILFSRLVFNTSYTFSGNFQAGRPNTVTNLINCSLGYKCLRNNAGQLSFAASDLLNQNNNFSRSSTELYTLTHTGNTLGRYYMLTFTYTLRNFSGNAAQS
jgi:hypothetical protein